MRKDGDLARFEDIDDRTEELRELAEQHPDIWGDFLHRYEMSVLYHENAMEGIVVTHAELSSALSGRPIAADTYYPIRNLKVASDYVRQSVADRNAPIDLEFMQSIHSRFGVGNPDFVAGDYRKIIPLHRTYFHDIAQPQDIVPRLEKLLRWAAENEPADDEAVQYAAHFHHEYMSIFPFSKYTGKVGRLLINYTLMRHGYMPVIFHATERQRYYDTLRHSKREMEKFLIDMMFNCVDNAVDFTRRTLEERRKKAEQSQKPARRRQVSSPSPVPRRICPRHPHPTLRRSSCDQLPLVGRPLSVLQAEELADAQRPADSFLFTDYSLATSPILRAFFDAAPRGAPARLALPSGSASIAPWAPVELDPRARGGVPPRRLPLPGHR